MTPTTVLGAVLLHVAAAAFGVVVGIAALVIEANRAHRRQSESVRRSGAVSTLRCGITRDQAEIARLHLDMSEWAGAASPGGAAALDRAIENDCSVMPLPPRWNAHYAFDLTDGAITCGICGVADPTWQHVESHRPTGNGNAEPHPGIEQP